MNMPKSLLLALAALVVLMSAQAIAQSTPDPSSQAGQTSSQGASMAGDDASKAKVQSKLDKISAELNLTDDQKGKIKPVLESEISQLQALNSDASLPPDQKKAKAKEIHSSAKTEINAVLTPEQQKKWSAMKESAKDNK
jgi:Spy/CpxP family protein refolding chaperone